MAKYDEHVVGADDLGERLPKARRYTVLFVVPELRVGGAEMMLLKILARLDSNQFRAIVVTLRPGGELEPEFGKLGIDVLTVGTPSRSALVTGLFRLFALMKRIKPDLIHGWLVHGNLASAVLGAKASKRAPIFWGMRHAALRRSDLKLGSYLFYRALRLAVRVPDAIVYNSTSGARDHEQIGYPPEKTVVIPNGFDVERFVPSRENYEHVRSELGLASTQRLIGLVARYHPMKDHLTFLRAAAVLAERDSRISFLLIGRDVDSGNRALCGSIERLGLIGRVFLLGERSDVPRLTAAMDVAVNSSFSEGFPNAIGEAMASGVPCVVTDVGDSGWLVGDTGVVVPSGDHGQLAIACHDLINLSDTERAVRGRRARERIESSFSINSVVRQYEQLFIDKLTNFR